MHGDEVEVDDALVRRLLAARMPDLADLPRGMMVSSDTADVADAARVVGALNAYLDTHRDEWTTAVSEVLR